MNTSHKRCAIVCDNGQRISQKDKDFMNTTSKNNKLISFFKSHIKNCKAFFEKTKADSPENLKKLRNTAIAIAVTGVLLCLSSVFFTAGYDVYIDGNHIGSVVDKKDFENIVAEVNTAASDLNYGSFGIIADNPVYVMKISLRGDITDADTLRKNVAERSAVLCFGSTVILDGTAAFTTENQDITAKAIEDVVNSYGGGDSKILTNIEYKNEYVARKDIQSSDSAYLQLRNLLKVETVKNVTYNENIPYETTTVEDDEMYEGEQAVTVAGVPGKSRVVANVTYVNGVETSRDIISTEEISPSSAETLAVGTKERPSDMGTGVMMLPFSGSVSSRFGARDGRRTSHKGVDIAGSLGSPVVAADNGKVIQAEYRYDYGNIIVVDHNNGLTTYYAHLNSMDVEVGDIVEKGQTIGFVGSTGISTGPHLHFEVRRDGTPIDPYSYMD